MNIFKNSTLDALQKSLIALSNGTAVHYETVCDQIERTRYAIMTMEGKPIDEAAQAEFLTLHQEKKRLAEEVKRLTSRRQFLLDDIKKNEEEKAELSEN